MFSVPIIRWGGLLCLLVQVGTAWSMDNCSPTAWPTWDYFKRTFISADGRVIDPATVNQYTTSEGQSYALFFSLVDNDPQLFARLLKWTEANLAQGDLTAHLPAWQWGKSPDGHWRVQDTNPAADADLWLAYTLSEAGRLWHEPRYAALGELVAQRILREERVTLPGLGPLLLPAPQGFHSDPQHWRLNPSYLPPALLEALHQQFPNQGWNDVLDSYRHMLNDLSQHHVVPDWVGFEADHGFIRDTTTGDVGSYDAIRVYLWIGLMAPGAWQDQQLAQLGGMADYIDAHGVPPVTTHWLTGQMEGNASMGFSAALLPYLSRGHRDSALQLQVTRLASDPSGGLSPNYYDQALTLFGQGWFEQRYQFSEKGALEPQWLCTNTPTRH